MQLLFAALISVSLFVSCSPDDGPDPVVIPPQPVDTLSTGWTKNPFFTFRTLVDVAFINNTGYLLAGDSLLKSTDGGRTWQNAYKFPDGESYVELAMGSEQNVCAGGRNPTVYVSKNGGASMNAVTMGDILPTGVFYSAPTIVYAGGKEIKRSQNAGDTWTPVATGIPVGSSGSSNIFFLNTTRGWMVNNAGLYQTVNSGDTWTNTSVPFTPSLNGASIVQFTDVNTGYVSTKDGIYKTTNGGTNWALLTSTTPLVALDNPGYPDIHFINNSLGYYVLDRRIYRTTDGGASWTKVVQMAPGFGLLELHFTDANHGWACGSGGRLLRFEQ